MKEALNVRAIMDPTPGYTGYSPSGFLGQQVEFLSNVLALAFAAIVMLLSIMQPWYILWFVPFLAAVNKLRQSTR